MIYMKERHWKIVQDVLNKHPYTFYAFGSRVKGTEKRFSDLDLCFKEPIPSPVIWQVEEEFEESNLPFKVDVLDWNMMTPEFQDLIEKDLTPITKTSHAQTHH
jgi:predicted nucleotidyltransferase